MAFSEFITGLATGVTGGREVRSVWFLLVPAGKSIVVRVR